MTQSINTISRISLLPACLGMLGTIPALSAEAEPIADVGTVEERSFPDGESPAEEEDRKPGNVGDWCRWLEDNPGELYESKKNPFIQSFEVEGRFQYQAYRTSGTDVRGNDFSDSGDEYRRFRLGTEVKFLNYFELELSVNLVDDRRFDDEPDTGLDWGYDDFDTASLGFDIGEAWGTGPFDEIAIRYGRMKLPLSEEVHQSSRHILTVERSSLADRAGGSVSRPTGVMFGATKDDWDLMLGVFSGEDDADFLGGWNDGQVYYGSLEWQATDEFRLLFDHAQNDHSGTDDILGYAWVNSLAGTYEAERWGTMVNFIYGDNGGASVGNDDPMQQGDFYGVIVMPWYWLVEERLQVVFRYQFAASKEREGVRTDGRYARRSHSPPAVDLDGGYGNEHHSYYLGFNYYLCGHNAKFMFGAQYEDMNARTENFDATTLLAAFRTYF